MQLLDKIIDELNAVRARDDKRITVVGIDGPTAAGKTMLAAALTAALRAAGQSTWTFQLDWALKDRAAREADVAHLREVDAAFEFEAELHMRLGLAHKALEAVARFNRQVQLGNLEDQEVTLTELYSRAAGAVRLPARRLAVIGLVVGGVCVAATVRTQWLYGNDDRDNGPTLRGFGQAVAALTTPGDPVFLPLNDAVLQYYVDRPMKFDVDTPQKLEAAAAATAGPYLIIVPERSARRFPELLAYLRARYPERRDRGLFMFQGGRLNEKR